MRWQAGTPTVGQAATRYAAEASRRMKIIILT